MSFFFLGFCLRSLGKAGLSRAMLRRQTWPYGLLQYSVSICSVACQPSLDNDVFHHGSRLETCPSLPTQATVGEMPVCWFDGLRWLEQRHCQKSSVQCEAGIPPRSKRAAGIPSTGPITSRDNVVLPASECEPSRQPSFFSLVNVVP